MTSRLRKTIRKRSLLINKANKSDEIGKIVHMTHRNLLK